MWNAFAVAGVVMMLVGFVAFVKPLGILRIPTRRRAAAVSLVGFIALAVAAVNDPAAQRRQPTSPDANQEATAPARPPVTPAAAAPDEPCRVEAEVERT
jgi:hypothetical protein